MIRPLICAATLLLSACAAQSDGPPKLLVATKPTYPRYAAVNHIDGNVRFNYDVGADGKVNRMQITESSPQHLFDDVTIRAVSQWRFETNKPTKNLKMNMVFNVRKAEEILETDAIILPPSH